MRPSMRRAGLLVSAAAVAVTQLAACGDDPGSKAGGGDGSSTPLAAGSVPASSDPLDVSGLIWASGSVVHLSDGTDVDLGQEPYRFAVGGDGVFFTTEDSGLEEGAVENHALFYGDRDGEVVQIAEGVGDPWASPDGRYLVYLDLASGEEDAYGAPQAETVIVDLESGEEVVRSTAGAGDPASDDFDDLYSEGQIGVRRVTDRVAYVGIGGTQEFELATGEVEEVPVDDQSWDVRPGDPRSPDGDWRIVSTPEVRDELQGPDGQRLVPDVDAPRWGLDFWADDRTVVGSAVMGPIGPRNQPFSDANTYELLSCTVPSGRCVSLPETTGETVVFPTGDTETGSRTLEYAG